MPLPFSIVIPTYNEAAGIGTLLGALDATFRENALDGEIIVVDDNSPDGTGAIVDELASRLPVAACIARGSWVCRAPSSRDGRSRDRSRWRSARWMPISVTT